MQREVIVGIADFKIVKAPTNILTIGLGSCVGVSLYEKNLKMVGLIHIMLPDSKKVSNTSNPFKFADTAIPLALKKMISMGANKSSIRAKVAGGAQMFKSLDSSMSYNIGERNILAVEGALKKEGICIVGKEVRGNKGRTMIVNSESGVITIKSLNKSIIEF